MNSISLTAKPTSVAKKCFQIEFFKQQTSINFSSWFRKTKILANRMKFYRTCDLATKKLILMSSRTEGKRKVIKKNLWTNFWFWIDGYPCQSWNLLDKVGYWSKLEDFYNCKKFGCCELSKIVSDYKLMRWTRKSLSRLRMTSLTGNTSKSQTMQKIEEIWSGVGLLISLRINFDK